MSALIVEIEKELNACLLPLRGKVGMGVLLTLRSTAPPSKSSPSGEDFKAKTQENPFQLLMHT